MRELYILSSTMEVIDYLCINILLVCQSFASSSDTYRTLYSNAITSYNQERWFECAALMNAALADRRSYLVGVSECRSQCRAAGHMLEIEPGQLVEEEYLNAAAKYSDCIEECKLEKFSIHYHSSVDASIEEAFDKRIPYDYLQLCAYKSEQYQLALSAAQTFLVANPDHIYMKSNIDFYGKLPEAKASNFIDLELKPYRVFFNQGYEAYGDANYSNTAVFMEKAVHEYYDEHHHCMTDCDASFDSSNFADFYHKVVGSPLKHIRRQLILEHWNRVLQCQVNCEMKLSIQISETQTADKYVAEHYSYLQYAYYQIGEVHKAVECVATHLLLRPDSEVMLFNKDFYMKELSLLHEDFKPRKEAIEYVEIKQNAKKLADAVSELTKADAIYYIKPDGAFGPHNDAFLREIQEYREKYHLNIVADSNQLEGDHRVAVDGVLSTQQCEQLVNLALVGASHGDGYSGRKTPHTIYESFAGLTVHRAAELARDGVVTVDDARAYLSASEASRTFVEKYFNLQVPLLFHFTHLVCREAIKDFNHDGRSDLSHPVHSDNCPILSDGSCPRNTYLKPRDISALLYLNDDFEGGNFFFAYKNLTVQKMLRPSCGRLVAFESGDYHGVQPVTSGRRCALAMWFTFTPNDRETSIEEAELILGSLETTRKQQSEIYSSPLQDLLTRSGYQLFQRETELKGPERFVADGLLSESQCATLIELSKTGGVVGDGYGKTSPHTNHELFQGLGVLRAAQLAKESVVDISSVRLYLQSSDNARDFVGKYFDKQIYFAYTHLVCRTALDDGNVDRNDLSHPIHSDNCIMQPDNSCKRERPAYIERDYSAIMYLNDDFSGGDFFFADTNKNVQSTVRPKCGRLVGFNSSNYHGVHGVIAGKRCAVALWFTLDRHYNEVARTEAYEIIDQLDDVKHSDRSLHIEL